MNIGSMINSAAAGNPYVNSVVAQQTTKGSILAALQSGDGTSSNDPTANLLSMIANQASEEQALLQSATNGKIGGLVNTTA